MATLHTMVVKLIADTGAFVSGMGGAGSTAQGAAGKIDAATLASQRQDLTLQKTAVQLQQQTERLARMTTAAGANSTAVEAQRIKVESLKLAMQELTVKEGAAATSADKATTAITKSGTAASQAEPKFGGLAGTLGRVGGGLAHIATVAGGLAVAGIGAGIAAIAGSTVASANWGDSLDAIGDVLGTTASESAALSVAIRGVGGNTEAITTQLGFMARGLKDTKGEAGPTGKAIAALGVAVTDANGNMKPTMQLLADVSTAIDAMPDGLEKTSIMMDVFGKSGKDMSDTIHALAGSGLDDAAAKAKAFGLDLGESGVANSIAFKRGMADIGMAVQGLAIGLGTQLMPTLLPLIQQFGQWAVGVMPQVGAAISAVVGHIAEFVNGVTTGQGTFGAFGQTIQAVVAWVTANWPTISATIGAVISSVVTFVQTQAIPAFQQIGAAIGVVVAFVQANWPLIAQTIETALTRIKVLWDAVWPVLLPILEATWTSIKGVVEAAIALVVGAVKVAMQLFNGDWEGAWQTAKDAAQGVWNGIVTFFSGIPQTMANIGNSMLEGLRQGIRDNATKVIQAIMQVIQDAVTSVKKFLGIESPSKLMMGIGANMAQGLNIGYSAALRPLSVPGFDAPMSEVGQFAPAAAGQGGRSTSQVNIYLGERVVGEVMVDWLSQRIYQDRQRYGA